MVTQTALRKKKGQSSVEMVAGLIFMVPIVLFLLDIGCMIVANYINDDLCNRAARAAANQVNATDATDSALRVMNKLDTSQSGILQNLESMNSAGTAAVAKGTVDYDSTNPGHVIATTRITVKLPVPFPVLPQTASFVARSCVPIVAQKAR